MLTSGETSVPAVPPHPCYSTFAMFYSRSRHIFALTSVSTCFRRFNPSSLTSIAFLSFVRPSHVLSSSPASSTYLHRQNDVERQNNLCCCLCHNQLLTSVSCFRSTLLPSDFGRQRSDKCCVSRQIVTSAQICTQIKNVCDYVSMFGTRQWPCCASTNEKRFGYCIDKLVLATS